MNRVRILRGFLSVIVFIINIPYLAVLDLERQALVPRDVQASDALAIVG